MIISLFPEKIHLINTVTCYESNVYYNEKILMIYLRVDGYDLDINNTKLVLNINHYFNKY